MYWVVDLFVPYFYVKENWDIPKGFGDEELEQFVQLALKGGLDWVVVYWIIALGELFLIVVLESPLCYFGKGLAVVVLTQHLKNKILADAIEARIGFGVDVHDRQQFVQDILFVENSMNHRIKVKLRHR